MVIEAGRPRPTTRRFTPWRRDPATGRLDLEFVLHGHGPASQWATQAQPGDQVAVSQPRRTYALPPDSRWLLLAGDESALPAMATLLEAIDPDVPVHVVAELEDSGHEVALPALRGRRRCAGCRASPVTAPVPRSRPRSPRGTPPPGAGQVWGAGEAWPRSRTSAPSCSGRWAGRRIAS